MTAISQEAREAVLRWKFGLWQHWEDLAPQLRTDPIHAYAADFVHRAARRQQRALARLRAIIDPLAVFGDHRIDPDAPAALWAVLRPRSGRLKGSTVPGERQQGVALYRLLICRAPDGRHLIQTKLWGLEVPDHALGRVLDRAGLETPLTGLVLGVWGDIRRQGLDDVALGSGPLTIHMLDGRFECDRVVAKDETGEIASLVRIKTWIAQSELMATAGFAFADVAHVRRKALNFSQ
jgi:hypothetical protein